jgi:hypothetical protein
LTEKVRNEQPYLPKVKTRDKVIEMLMDNLTDHGTSGYDIKFGHGIFRYHPEHKPDFGSIAHNKYFHVDLSMGNN